MKSEDLESLKQLNIKQLKARKEALLNQLNKLNINSYACLVHWYHDQIYLMDLMIETKDQEIKERSKEI